jgi:hypothetical protein
MPVSSFVDTPSRLVITLCVGEIALSEIVASFDEIRNHSGFHPDFRQLCDLSMVSSIPLHFPDLYHLQQSCDPFSNQGRRAIVAPEAVSFGLSRMYQLIVNSPNLEVFRALPDALAFLDWNGALLEEIIRELLANKSVASAEKPASQAAPQQLDEFLKRLRKASSA